MYRKGLYTLVTGASSGIGRCIAINKAKCGPVLLHGRNQETLKETLNMCEGEGHLIWNCDLEGTNVADSLRTLLINQCIFVGSFIHCAGLTSILPSRSLSRRIGQKIMSVNCLSALEIISILNGKKSNGENLHNILFISSIWSAFGARGYTYYCASKAAIDGAMRALAIELAPKVRVNSVLLGAIKTKMSRGTFDDDKIYKKLLCDYPLGIGEKKDVVDMVNFVTSYKSKWMTGQQIVLDGGRTINMSLK